MDIADLLRYRDDLEDALQRAIATRNAMEGKMQSRYDTQREEWAMECDILEAQLERVDNLISALRGASGSVDGRVSVGATVRLSIDGEGEGDYIVLDMHGGRSVGSLRVLSTRSPIGSAILGRVAGDILDVPVPDGTIRVRIVSVV